MLAGGGSQPEMAFTWGAQPPGDDALSGDVLNKEVKKVIEAEQVLQVLQDIQQRKTIDGTIPVHPRTILLWFRQPLVCTGGILLGAVLGVVTLVFNFLVFNWVLHMEF